MKYYYNSFFYMPEVNSFESFERTEEQLASERISWLALQGYALDIAKILPAESLDTLEKLYNEKVLEVTTIRARIANANVHVLPDFENPDRHDIYTNDFMDNESQDFI